jgi:hypothetical protein
MTITGKKLWNSYHGICNRITKIHTWYGNWIFILFSTNCHTISIERNLKKISPVNDDYTMKIIYYETCISRLVLLQINMVIIAWGTVVSDYTGCLWLWKFNRLIINVASKQLNFYIRRKNSYLAFQWYSF